MDRKSLAVGICILLTFVSGCGALRTARIRKEVTINHYRDTAFRILPGSRIVVIPSVRKDASLGGIPFSANEAAAEIMSVKLWNQKFRTIDKIFIKEVLLKKAMEFDNYSVKEAVVVGKELDAEYVMLTSLTELDETTRSIDFGPFHVFNTVDTSVLVGMNCRLVDVEAGRTVWTGVATTQDKNLQLALRRISLHLIYTLRNGEKRPKDRQVPLLGIHY